MQLCTFKLFLLESVYEMEKWQSQVNVPNSSRCYPKLPSFCAVFSCRGKALSQNQSDEKRFQGAKMCVCVTDSHTHTEEEKPVAQLQGNGTNTKSSICFSILSFYWQAAKWREDSNGHISVNAERTVFGSLITPVSFKASSSNTCKCQINPEYSWNVYQKKMYPTEM